jgi:hypothetical protein
MPAFQPYWGKPAVRNDRGDRGNVGIIRSPVRASVLPDRRRATASGDPVGEERPYRDHGPLLRLVHLVVSDFTVI